jgi:DNA-binding IclR family transcriptional regulator
MSKSPSTADKVLDVLLLFQESWPELTAEEICELIDAPRSTTYRYIRILRDKGFLEKSATGGFRLGPRLLQLGRIARSRLDISDIALPVMEDIARQTRETVLLTRLFGGNAVCVERIQGPQTVRISFEIGQVQPLHGGASSKILLAYVDENEWDKYLTSRLERFTEYTITEPEALKEQLREIRRQGYCVSESEVDLGARAVAVPIKDARGRVVAGLSTAGPVFRMDDDTVDHHLALLRSGASTIQDQLVAMGF